MILQICITNVQPVQTAFWRFDDGGLEVVRESDLDRVNIWPAILLPFPGDQEGLATHHEPRVSHARTEIYTPPSVLLILEHIAMSSAMNVVVCSGCRLQSRLDSSRDSRMDPRRCSIWRR